MGFSTISDAITNYKEANNFFLHVSGDESEIMQIANADYSDAAPAVAGWQDLNTLTANSQYTSLLANGYSPAASMIQSLLEKTNTFLQNVDVRFGTGQYTSPAYAADGSAITLYDLVTGSGQDGQAISLTDVPNLGLLAAPNINNVYSYSNFDNAVAALRAALPA